MHGGTIPHPHWLEFGFDLEPNDPHSNYLPDQYVVGAEMVAAVARGDFDYLPDCTPLFELVASERGRA